ncbi:hypothetical protein PBY51_024921 [Eleginops maclovinus]|uniref:Ig-like domain-containing protein n=1 Tax=Eleginops maclovinus TaxID=56733 RepID=A0AAN8AVC5_ELEMC|nr:hypothetical protein PBY51_024921 [Eleginops maclovinus]
MDTTLTFIVLLRCLVVCSRPSRQSVSFSMVFSDGTLLLVDADEDEVHLHHQKQPSGSAPSIKILSSVPFSLDSGSPHMLVCILTGLNSPRQDVLWWVDEAEVTSSGAIVSRMISEDGKSYSVAAVWEVPAAEWRSGSTYWCGTVQVGRVYREKLCSQD